MECQICHEILETSHNYCITKCNHRFCCECIFTWTRKSQKCPMCRMELYKLFPNDTDVTDNNDLHSIRIMDGPFFIEYQNNFIQFLKENVMNQYPMYISIIYRKLIEQCISYKQNTVQNWQERIRQLLNKNDSIISILTIESLSFYSKNELEYENHPTQIMEKICNLEETDTEIDTFNHIVIECLFLYHLKNGGNWNNFKTSIQSVHNTIFL